MIASGAHPVTHKATMQNNNNDRIGLITSLLCGFLTLGSQGIRVAREVVTPERDRTVSMLMACCATYFRYDSAAPLLHRVVAALAVDVGREVMRGPGGQRMRKAERYILPVVGRAGFFVVPDTQPAVVMAARAVHAGMAGMLSCTWPFFGVVAVCAGGR